MRIDPIDNNLATFQAKLKLSGDVEALHKYRKYNVDYLKCMAETIGTKKDTISINVGEFVKHKTQSWSEMGHRCEVTPASMKILANVMFDNEKLCENKNIGFDNCHAMFNKVDMCFECIENFLFTLRAFDKSKKMGWKEQETELRKELKS